MPRTSRPAPLAARAWLLTPLLLVLALDAAAFLWFAARLVGYPYDLDQGEGYDAWSGWLINLGQVPYTDNASRPYYSSSYPPVWSYLISVPMAWLGPGLAPARAVSVVAAVLAAALVGRAAARGPRPALAAVLAAGFFLASPYVFHTTPLARVNGTALALSVAGLLLVESSTRRGVLLGGLALLAALFAKPTAVDALAAAGLSLLVVAPRRALLAGAAMLGPGLVLLALLLAVTRGAFWLDVVTVKAAIPWVPGQVFDYGGNLLLTHGVLLVAACAVAVAALRRALARGPSGERVLAPWPLYLLASAVMGLVSVAKAGSGESYFLGLVAAACVLAGPAAARLLLSPRLPLALAAGLALLVQAALMAHAPLSDWLPWLPDRGLQAGPLGRPPSEADRAAGDAVAGLVGAAPGPVLVEDASFAVAGGKQVEGNAAHLRDLDGAGLWDPAGLVSDVRARRYGIVVLDAQRYPDAVLRAIGASYYLARAIDVGGTTQLVFLPGRE